MIDNSIAHSSTWIVNIELNTLQLRVKVLIAKTQFTTISSNDRPQKTLFFSTGEKFINVFNLYFFLRYRKKFQQCVFGLGILLTVLGYNVPSIITPGLRILGTLLFVPAWMILYRYVFPFLIVICLKLKK